MGEPLTDAAVEARLTRLDDLLTRLEQIPGPTAETALDAVATLTEVYGTALARVMAAVAGQPALVDELAADELIGHLLLLHGLHPDPVEQRVTRALDEARSHLGTHAGIELSGIDDGVARLLVTASGCGSSAGAVASAVADVVLAAAPELAAVEPVTVKPPAKTPLIPVESLLHRPEVGIW